MLSQTYTLDLIQALECKLCKQHIHTDRVLETMVSVKIFGAKGYAVCPSCGQDNLTEMNLKRWQNKVDKFITKLKGRI